MRIDVRNSPTVLQRKKVVDLSTGLDIPDIIYADDILGIYGTYKRKNDYSRDVETDNDGNPVIVEHSPGPKAIRIVRK
jgi:hypothetical protein